MSTFTSTRSRARRVDRSFYDTEDHIFTHEQRLDPSITRVGYSDDPIRVSFEQLRQNDGDDIEFDFHSDGDFAYDDGDDDDIVAITG